MMVHISERYFTNTKEVETGDRICEGLYKAIIEEAPKVMKNPLNYDARANIMWAGMIAHNWTSAFGMQECWCSHFMEHELSAVYNVTHGEGLSVIYSAFKEKRLKAFHVTVKPLLSLIQIFSNALFCIIHYEFLLQEASLFKEFADTTIDDILNQLLRFAFFTSFVSSDFFLTCKNISRNIEDGSTEIGFIAAICIPTS
jgi:hypothetical protein